MAGSLLIAMLGTAFAADCDVSTPLDQAEDLVLGLALDEGQEQLDAAEDAFGCGVATREEVARFFLLNAALSSFASRAEERDEYLQAAKNADETYWMEVLGAELKSRWDRVSVATKTGTVELAGLPRGYTVRVDGTEVDGGRPTVSVGQHVVQARGGDNGFGRVVRVAADETVVLNPGLPKLSGRPTPEPVSPVPVPDPDPDPVEPAETRAVAVFAAAGLVFSTTGTDQNIHTNSVRVGPSVEGGVILRPSDGVWVRATLGLDVVRSPYITDPGPPSSTGSLPVSPALLAGAGVAVNESVDVGALLGVQLPARTPIRLVGSYALSPLLRVEARAGANLLGQVTVTGAGATTRSVSIEPALAAFATAAF